MRSFIAAIIISSLSTTAAAQETRSARGETAALSSSFDAHTRIVSFGMGFPNLYRINYDAPSGYTHLKTTGFGPVYAKFELAAFEQVGLVAGIGYSTFHYSYYGFSPQVVHYDDVNTFSLSLSGNYHFSKLIANPRLDIYTGVGLSVDYQKYTYGNIPPYKSPERKASIHPVIRAGGRYYLDNTFGIYGEAGYDGLSIIQLGFSVRF